MTYRRNPAILAQALDDQIVLLSADQSALLNLNSSGAAVWNAFEEPGTIDDVVGRLTAEFPGADTTVLRADVEKFVAEMHGLDALVLEP